MVLLPLAFHTSKFFTSSRPLLHTLQKSSLLGAIQPWIHAHHISGEGASCTSSAPIPSKRDSSSTACRGFGADSQNDLLEKYGHRIRLLSYGPTPEILFVQNSFENAKQLPDMAVVHSKKTTLAVSKSKEIQVVGERGNLQPRQHVIRVYAYFVGRKIDLVGVSSDSQIRHSRRASGRDHVIVELQGKGNDGGSAHLVVYKYGSIVLFNAPLLLEQHQDLMQFCQRHTSEPILQPHHEVQSVVVVPQMTNWYKQEGDRIKVKELDLDNMRVISSVLGQSVALDQYSRQIDRALGEFNSINREMERTGSFTVTRQELFRLVARNNMMITEAILVLGLLDRSDTAWTNDKYYGVWSMMQSEYELAQRFEAMDKKLNLIQDSAKYFLQILQDNKSVTLEWFIIILIMAEVVVGVYDISTRAG